MAAASVYHLIGKNTVHEISNRNRFHGENGSTCRRLLRGSDAARGGKLRHQRPEDARRIHRSTGADQKMRGRDQPGAWPSGRPNLRSDPAGRRRHSHRQDGWAVRRRCVSDRIGNIHQHECERGDRGQGERVALRKPGREVAGASQRPREPGPVEQRRNPVRDQRVRACPDQGKTRARPGTAQCRASPESAGFFRGEENRTDPSSGRGPLDFGKRIFRLRPTDEAGCRKGQGRRTEACRAGLGRHCGGQRIERGAGLRILDHRKDRAGDQNRFQGGRQPFRGAGGQGRGG